MNILILNWRDIKNPDSGGAEVLTHEIAKRWVEKGNQVTQFSSYFRGADKNEVIDGVKIIRRGHPDARFIWRSVHFLAFYYYISKFKGKFDLVIDEVHGLPFFTPLYVKEKKVALVCEVADNIWIKMFGNFFGNIGRTAEIFYLRFLYRNIKFITISNSTKFDLIKNKVNPRNIVVLPMGISVPGNPKKERKEENPTAIFVGRLAKTKGIEDALKATAKLISWNGRFKLWIIGRGNIEYKRYLEKLIERLGIKGFVVFFDFVDEKRKFELMSKAHVLISPSVKEGFGLTIPEAGRVGTPAVVYNSPGLSEVVINSESGLVCRENTSYELYNNIKKIFVDKNLYERLRKGAILQSKKYDWQKTSDYFMNIIKNL